MEHTISIFLLDDDPVFLSALEEFLQEQLKQYPSCAFRLSSFGTVSAMLAAAAAPPDLLISDIDLPDSENGISGAGSLHTIAPNCSIIYLTSHLEYAPDIFETEPLYFVLKDSFRSRLPDALQKFFARYQKANQKLQLYSGGETVTVALEDIIYCEHLGKNVRVVCRMDEYSFRSSLTEFRKQLPPEQFSLCHKSYLVNLAHVRSLSSLQVTMDQGTTLNISRSCRDAFRLAHSRWISSLL